MSMIQEQVSKWVRTAFGERVANDRKERGHRFLEEALELVQAGEITREDAHALVDYVYGRPVGELEQEVGGASLTLLALCAAYGVDQEACARTELARAWANIEKIRAKQAAKPKVGPLAEAYDQKEIQVP